MPKDLLQAVGRAEISRSLRTSCRKSARAAAGTLYELTGSLWRKVRQVRIPSEIGPLIERWMAVELDSDSRVRDDVSWAMDHVRPGETLDMAAHRMLNGEAIGSLERWQEAVEAADWKVAETAANALIASNGLQIEKGSQEHRFVCRIMALAELEVAGVKSDRCIGRWSAPEMPYGLNVLNHSIAPASIVVEPGEPLSVLIPKFLDEKKRLKAYQPKRIMDFEAALELFQRFVRNDPSASKVNRRQIGEFRDLLVEFPTHATKLFPGADLKSIREMAKADSLPTLAPQTINTKYLSVIDGFFRWCISCGVLSENPASGIRVDNSMRARERVRRPFQPDHLAQLFKAPLFVGCRSSDRIYEPGSHRVTDHRYWLPILALYTGAREGELCQLRLEDIREIEGVLCIDINRRAGSVKTDAAERVIPVHAKLREIGFVDHVEKCRTTGQSKLFPEIKIGVGGYASENVSKWFSRLLKKTFGIEKKVSDGLTFHSFRHTFKDALRDAGVEERIQDVILGHENDHVSGRYGHGYKAPRLADEVAKVNYGSLTIG